MKAIDLSVNYAGLRLRNPLVVSGSELTNDAERNEIYANKGIGAIVLKSIFEEQILAEIQENLNGSFDFQYPEAEDYLKNYITQNHLSKYLNLIKESKARTDVPIIASINCYTDKNWIHFTKEIEKAGADAIEINIMYLETDPDMKPGSTELLHLKLIQQIRKEVKIPIIVKISRQFTNLVALINQLHHNGANGIVVFNRGFLPDIDIDKMTFTTTPSISEKSAFHEIFRWIGIISAMVPDVDLAASGGVHVTSQIIKAILAGASTVQICSVLYKNGPDIIPVFLTELQLWMQEHGFDSIESMKGVMNQDSLDGENHYLRMQFMKQFASQTQLN